MSLKVLIGDKFEKAGIEGLKGLGCTVVSMPDVGADGLAAALADQSPDVLVVRSTKVRKAALDSGKPLKAVIRAGAGVDNIEIPAATARSVAVCNTPGMNAAAVAELTFAMILGLDRRLVEQVADLRAGVWKKKEYAKARGIKGQTLGIIGVGNIGREVTRRAKAFGMDVWAHSLNMTAERALDLGVHFGGSTRPELYRMLGQCDVVSVHAAANKESDRLCDKAFFDAMKPGAIFINTARGSVVDENALREAISRKGLRAGLDVFDGEPATGEAAWVWNGISSLSVYGTHHVGASTDQAQNAVADEVVRIVKAFKDSGIWENRVN